MWVGKGLILADLDHQSLSRRTALVRLGAGGLGAALAARSISASAQQATPEDLPPALADWIAAWEALDIDGIAAAYAEDAVHEDVPANAVFEGREAIRAHLEPLATELTDSDVQITHVVATENGGAVEWIFTGTYTGQIPGFPPGNGTRVAIRGASIFELAGGQIQRDAEYYDVLALLVQLGIVPGPAEGTPEATPDPAPPPVR